MYVTIFLLFVFNILGGLTAYVTFFFHIDTSYALFMLFLLLAIRGVSFYIVLVTPAIKDLVAKTETDEPAYRIL